MLQTLNNLINIRNALRLSIEDAMVKMTPQTSFAATNRLALLNKKILDLTLSLDIDKEIESSTSSVRRVEVKSTSPEPKDINELDAIVAKVNSKEQTVKDHKIASL